MARNATGATISSATFVTIFQASTAGGSDGSPLRGVVIQSVSGLIIVSVDPIDEGQEVTIKNGEIRTIDCGKFRAITRIRIRGTTASARDYSFWPTG
jgi:hypothetical protein